MKVKCGTLMSYETMDSELADFCEWFLWNIMLAVEISDPEPTPINHEKSGKLKENVACYTMSLAASFLWCYKWWVELDSVMVCTIF